MFSDIHSNFHALKAVLDEIETLNVDRYYCCGDVVGYGAFPNECMNLLRELDCPIVAGNHDLAVLQKTDISYFNDIAKAAIGWTQSVLTAENLEFLEGLPMTYEEGDFFFVHASPKNPPDWNYIQTFGDARINFQFFNQKICFIGHSHQPFIIEFENNNIVCASKPEIEIADEKRYLVNVGSVGQPRDRNPLPSYVFCDLDEHILKINRIEYDMKSAQESIINAGLPIDLAERLNYGI